MAIDFNFLNDPVILIFFWVFAISLLVQLGYFWIVFSKLAFYKAKQSADEQVPVSVVVTAHNNYIDLRSNLPYLLEQDYPEFEIMVVNDNSTDGSDELLQDLSKQYNNLRIVDLKQQLNWFKGRKFPLSLGIKSAQYDLLLLTDITCRPQSKLWLHEMATAYNTGTEIILSYASFHTGSKLNFWYRFSAFYDGLFYISMALAGIPFKGIGKNLSYKKQLFYRRKGFSSHYKIDVGDDELFINQTAKKSNTRVQISSNSKITHVKAFTISQWFKAEKSLLLIRKYFKTSSRILLSLFHSGTFLFYLSFILLLVFGANWIVILSLFCLRLVSQMLIFGLAAKKLGEKNLLLLSPLLEILLIIINFLIWTGLLFSRKNKWR